VFGHQPAQDWSRKCGTAVPVLQDMETISDRYFPCNDFRKTWFFALCKMKKGFSFNPPGFWPQALVYIGLYYRPIRIWLKIQRKLFAKEKGDEKWRCKMVMGKNDIFSTCNF
jgi:hypothetical protein